MAERIISVGLLTRSDLSLLGQGFDRHFPIPEDGSFADLLAKLDEAVAQDKRENQKD